MNTPRILLPVAGLCLLSPLVQSQAQDAQDQKRPAAADAKPKKKGRVVQVQMAEGLRFDPPRFEAKPGELISLELENADPSHQPHNFLIVKPGQVQEIVKIAMEMGDAAVKRGFVPENPAILASSGQVLEPEKQLKVEFTVPQEPGIYGYVCTVPGHGLVMYGAMYVGVQMPPLAKDTNIPQLTLEKGLAGGGRRPFVQRLFMPQSGPASIGVALPGALNFCFDAGTCRVRYAWKGVFMDGSRYWKGNGKDLAELGDAPWWTSTKFPLVLGAAKTAAEPKFLGYRLVAGVPEFHFQIGKQDVFQTVQATEQGLEFRFRLPGIKSKVTFLAEAEAGWICEVGGKRKDGFEVPAGKAAEFSVVLPAPGGGVKAGDTSVASVAAAPVPAPPPADGAPVAAARKLTAKDQEVARFYNITQVKGPQGVDAQVGAIATLPDGRIAVAFHRGEIAFYNADSKEWNVFAEGLHEPLGLLPEADGSLLVMQRPELTRLKDTAGAGRADRYDTVWDGFGMTGNYHEFAFGPLREPSGKLFVAFNLASSGDTVHEEVRGEWLPIGLDRKGFYNDWKANSKLAGRMYSRVPWRGWVMEVDPATGKAEPFASGFRSPDGLGFDAAGNLVVSDNQGDWRGSSELHVVKKGGFYGHPASLPWRKGWGKQPPLEVPLETLNKLRTPAAVWFPHMSYANSPTQMVLIPKSEAWGPYGGQLVIGEMNVPKLLRVTLEEVGGVWQGACYPFIETASIDKGLHRLAFAGDRLWLGRTHLTWAGGENLAYIEPTKEHAFDPLEVRVHKTGFNVRFTKPLSPEAKEANAWNIRRYSYAYHEKYGSPELDEEWIVPTSVVLSEDGLGAELTLPALHEDFVYDFYFDRLRSKEGEVPLNVRAAYTLRRKP